MYSSEDNVSEFEMVGDESCPFGGSLVLLLWFNFDKVEIHELRPKVITEDEGGLVLR